MNVDENICCKIKLNKNTNPLTGNPFTKKEEDIKNEYIKTCNRKFQGKSPMKSKEIQDKVLPINIGIDLKNKDNNINIAKNNQEKDTGNFTDKNKRSAVNILKSPKVININKKSPVKQKILKKNKKLSDYTYLELKNMYKNKMNKKLTVDIFNKFKKTKKILKNKYVSNLTKDEYIELIKFLKL